METLTLKLSDVMNIVAELDTVGDTVYFHAHYTNGEKASRGYSSDLLDVSYSYGMFETEIEAMPYVEETWGKVVEWIKNMELSLEQITGEDAREQALEIQAETQLDMEGDES